MTLVFEQMSQPQENSSTDPIESLPAAPAGWLEQSISKLSRVFVEFAQATDADEAVKLAIIIGRREFGFNRISCWFFENNFESAIGTYGFDEHGALCDERECRIFDRQGMIANMRQSWEKPPYIYVGLKHVLRSGSARAVGSGAQITVPLNFNGECRGFMAVDNLIDRNDLNDMSGCFLSVYAALVSSLYFERKANENARSYQLACEQAEQVKSEFLRMIGHEIRTPLNAIMGYAQLLNRNELPENLKPFVKIIEENGSLLTNLINGILEYTHLSGSELKYWQQPCDPVLICRSTLNTLSKKFAKKGVGLSFRQEGDSNELVMADALSLREVVKNLLHNALKFTEEGEVTLAVQSKNIGDTATQFLITVKDTGIGIESSRLQEIFQPFKQLDSSLTRKAGGIGMGLAIVKRLVEVMGGNLKCESVPGEGSTFSLDIVLENVFEKTNDEEPALPSAASKREVDFARFRILLASDETMICETLGSFIENIGYEVPVVAATYYDAVDALKSRPYDLVFVDMEADAIDSFTLVRDIRGGRCGPINDDVQIVGLAGEAQKIDCSHYLLSGMNEYMTKPLERMTVESYFKTF